MAEINPFAPFDRQASFEAQLLKGAQSDKELATQGAIQQALQRRIGHNTLLNTAEQGKNAIANTTTQLGVPSQHAISTAGITPSGIGLLNQKRNAEDFASMGQGSSGLAQAGTFTVPGKIATPTDILKRGMVTDMPTGLLAALGGKASTVVKDRKTEKSAATGKDGSGTVETMHETTDKTPDARALEDFAARRRGTPPAATTATAASPTLEPVQFTPQELAAADESIMLNLGKKLGAQFNRAKDVVEIDGNGWLYVNGVRQSPQTKLRGTASREQRRRLGAAPGSVFPAPGASTESNAPDFSSPPIPSQNLIGRSGTWSPR